MNEIYGNMFSPRVMQLADAICITTNGFVKKDGCCVMGAGTARIARDTFSGIDKELGSLIKKNGNIVQIIRKVGKTNIVSFPVKHNWWEKADIKLIEQSIQQLEELTYNMGWKMVVLPRPGCNNGRLNWLSEVKPVLTRYIRNNEKIYVISF